VKISKRPSEPFLTVNPPLHRASTVLYDTYESYLAADRKPYHGKLYGTYGSPVQLDEALDDGQPKAGTPPSPAIGARLETAKDAVEDLARHARAVIVHTEVDARGGLFA
jgi:hypothetical protein